MYCEHKKQQFLSNQFLNKTNQRVLFVHEVELLLNLTTLAGIPSIIYKFSNLSNTIALTEVNPCATTILDFISGVHLVMIDDMIDDIFDDSPTRMLPVLSTSTDSILTC